MNGSQQQVEAGLVSLADLNEAAVTDKRRPGLDDVRSICAVVSRAVSLQKVQSKKRAAPYYFVEFEVADNSSCGPLSVKLWGEVERFAQLKHQLVQGTTVVLQSVVLHSDYFRGNRLTIQESRYGYSSRIYIVKDKGMDEGGDFRYYLDIGNENIPTIPLFHDLYSNLVGRILELEKWKRTSSTFGLASCRVKPAFASGLTEAAKILPMTTNSTVDICLVVEAHFIAGAGKEREAGVAYYSRDLHVTDLAGKRARLELHGNSRAKFEDMLRDCMVVGSVEASHGSLISGQCSSSSSSSSSSRKEIESIVVLVTAASVLSSHHDAVDALKADERTSFFGFNDSRRHFLLGDVPLTSFEEMYASATTPSAPSLATRKPKFFRFKCLLKEADFAEGAVHLPLPPHIGKDSSNIQAGPRKVARTPSSYDANATESVPPPTDGVEEEVEAETEETCRVLVSRLVETRSSEDGHLEVMYRDAVFSIGSTEEGDEEKKEDAKKRKRDADGDEVAKSGASDEGKSLPPPSAVSFVYSALSGSAPPIPPSAHSTNATLQSDTQISHQHHRSYRRDSRGPRDSQMSQLHSYYSQAQPGSLSTPQGAPRIPLMVKGATLTELFCNIPAVLATVCLAKEKLPEESQRKKMLPSLTHNFADSIRMLVASIARSAACEGGVPVECTVEVLPRNKESGQMVGAQHLVLLHRCNFL